MSARTKDFTVPRASFRSVAGKSGSVYRDSLFFRLIKLGTWTAFLNLKGCFK
jgi:hypothetical protein